VRLNCNILLFLSFFLFIGSTAIQGQTYKQSEKRFKDKSFRNENAELHYLAAKEKHKPQPESKQKNATYISQIGDWNILNSTTNALTSDITIKQSGTYNEIYLDINGLIVKEELVQNGNYNKIDLEITAAMVNEDIIQQGDYNTVIYSNPNNLLLHKGKISQDGDNLTLLWEGDNSISKHINIKMKGDNKTIEVRNN
jgi:hypothetical protein